MSRLISLLIALLLALPVPSLAKDPLATWKPAFDPSTAKHKYILSCVGHPAIEGVAVGYRIRDRVWKETGGRLYVDFRPLSQLGGEKDVIRKLKLGAVHGMMSSSVAAANLAPELGIVNLPFLVGTFDQLEQFRRSPELFTPFATAARKQGLRVIDFTGYGSYGWASKVPVTGVAQAGEVNFRIAQAPVNTDIYKAWGLKFTVMPWPDVPQALQTGVIDGLDHTPIVCNISKKFDVAKHFTRLDYAQGLYVHLINERWLKRLPDDLQTILLKVIEEESAQTRKLTLAQQNDEIIKAQKAGIRFYDLSDTDKTELIRRAEPVYQRWGSKMKPGYLAKVREKLQ